MKSFVRAVSRGLVAAFLLAALIAAGGPGSFDPARDLEGFEAIFHSDMRELYALDKYADLLGKELPPAELERVRREWSVDKQRGDAQASRLREHPPELQLYLLQRALARQGYFSKIDLEENREHPPLVFLLQMPHNGDAAYVRAVAEHCAPWFERVAAAFDELYAQPLQLARRPDYPLQPIALLPGAREYRSYSGQSGRGGEYDAGLRLVIGAADACDKDAQQTQARIDLLASFAQGLIDAHQLGATKTADSLWLSIGLSSYLAFHTGSTPATLEQRELPSGALDTLLRTCAKSAQRELVLVPMAELVGVHGIEELIARSKKLAEERGATIPGPNEIIECLRAQAVLAMHFLQDADGGRRRAAFQDYLRLRMSGTSDHDAFFQAFDEEARAGLDAAFYDYVFDQCERVFPERPLARNALRPLFASAPAVEAAGDAPTPPSAVTPVAVPAFDPRKLALDPSFVDAQYGLALVEARRGELEAARARVRRVVHDAGGMDARSARELERIDQLIALRNGYLEALAASKVKWTGEYEGKKIVAPIARIEDGFLILGENRQGVAKLPLSAIPPLEIAKQADKKEEQGSARAWARSYAYLLAGDPKWDKLPRDMSDEMKALREDAQRSLPNTLRLGEAALEIDALAHSVVPKTAAEAEIVLSAIKRLASGYANVSLVEQRRASLKDFARSALALTFDDAALGRVLSGTLVTLGDGRVRLSYDFDAPLQAGELVAQTGVLQSFFRTPLASESAAQPATLAVADGNLVALGAGSWKHRLRFSGALKITAEFQFELVDGEDVALPCFEIALCAEGDESAIIATASGDLFVRDAKQHYAKQSLTAKREGLELGAEYKLEIASDGEHVTTALDGARQHDLACGPRRAGALLLLTQCETPLLIHRLEIEGTPDAASKSEALAAWTALKLAELGLP